MTLFSSFYSGLSGLNAYSMAMNVIGNNIANINTVGFKSGISTFQDLFSRTISGSQRAFQVGLGVTLTDVDTSIAQGALESTASPLDVAIQGNGMFILKESENSTSNLYTRAGNFGIDSDGFLVTSSGLLVQGWEYNGNTLSTDMSSIKIFAGASLPGMATSEIELAGNLNADDEVINPVPFNTAIDPDDPLTYNFKQTIRIFDSLGGEHTVQICFQKNDPDTTVGSPTEGNSQWTYTAFVDGSELDSTPPVAGWQNIADGVLYFDENGALNSVEVNSTTTFKFGIADSQSIALDFGTPIDQGGSGFDGLTQMFSETTSISFYTQNGMASGELESVTVDSSGVVTGFFSNGQTRHLAKIALASFANYAGLNKLGNNIFGETFASGSAIEGEAATGGRGKMVANALEMSNVDLAREFTSMIVGQRGFQANSRIISTTDEMIQEVLMIKR